MTIQLPQVRGKYLAQAELAALTWFRVGGPAETMFLPEDEEDLANFLRQIPKDIPVTTLGVGSNLLVREGGIPGVVIRLGKGFSSVNVEGEIVDAGAGILDTAVAKAAQKAGVAGLEFFRGIPGTIGGALRMNAGSYGAETKDILVSCIAYSPDGERHEITVGDMGFSYRHCEIDEDWIFTSARFRGNPDSPEKILARMAQITDSREASQPVRSRTGGSTFKNPDPGVSNGRKAWQLIDDAGCRGLKVGGAMVSEKHCNFLINEGEATAQDLEVLGEEVKRRVQEASGVELAWEIRRVGVKTVGQDA